MGTKEKVAKLSDDFLAQFGINPGGTGDTSARALDRICSDFEQSWSSKNTLEDIKRIAEGSPSECKNDVLLELALSDMELRWKEWSDKECVRFFQQLNPITAESCIPSSTSYANELGIKQHQQQLLDWEIRQRTLFGDFPTTEQPIESEACFLRMADQNGSRFESEFFGSLSGGRKNRNEPDPVAFCDASELKLVFAEENDRTVSRNQFKIDFFTRALVWIRNTSSNRAFGVHANQSREKRNRDWSREK